MTPCELPCPLDDELMASAREYVGESITPSLLRMALTALIQREAARRLAALGGADPGFRHSPTTTVGFLILVDTSHLVDHIRGRAVELRRLLEEELVLGHPFVIGELRWGTCPTRRIWLRDLGRLALRVDRP